MAWPGCRPWWCSTAHWRNRTRRNLRCYRNTEVDMSFILDALKKSETERQRADAPALYEMKMAPPRHGVALWLIVLATLLVINVVVLSVVLLRGSHGAPQTDAGAVATPPAAAAP